MNQRIRQLAEQAGIYQLDIGDETAYWVLGQFAQLIVQECANIAYNKQYKHSPAHTTGDCAQAIREHFGVDK